MHKLLTKDIIKSMPGPRSQENATDPMIHAHFFSCRNGWDWWAYEAWAYVNRDGEDVEVALKDLKPGEQYADIIFFGYVNGIEGEFGTFSLKEFEQTNEQFAPGGRGLLAVERDMHWKPMPLSEAKRRRGIH